MHIVKEFIELKIQQHEENMKIRNIVHHAKIMLTLHYSLMCPNESIYSHVIIV